MLYFNVALVIVLTIGLIFYTYRHRENLTCMAGMMIAMTIGMMGSVTLGMLLGIAFNRELVPSSMMAISFGVFAGFLAGRPISLMAALDGMMAGVMGGMMGAMLGVMLNEPQLMMWFVVALFLMMMTILLQMIKQEAGLDKKENDSNVPRKSFLSNPAVIISVFLLVGIIILGGQVSGLGKSVSKTIERISPDDHEATVIVSAKGYAPDEIRLKSGLSAKINFKVEPNAACLKQVVVKDMGLNSILEEGDNYFTFKDWKPGTYTYTCGMGMYKGKIVIE